MMSIVLLVIAIFLGTYYQASLFSCKCSLYCAYVLAGLGFYKVQSHLLCFLSGIWNYILQPHINFRQKYFDQDSWVVITGGTEGIGWGFANFFAQRKFNICLLSRNKSNLQIKQQELEQMYQIKTKVIAADFNSITISFYQTIYSQLEGLDVAILVNNIGGITGETVYFKEESINSSYQTIAKNILSTSFLSQHFIPIMLKRQKKSAIINLGSGIALIPCIGTAIYGACKAYNYQLTQTMQLESKIVDKGKIDFLCFAPN